MVKKKSAPSKKPAAAPRRTKKPQGDIIFALDIGTRTVVGILAQKQREGFKIIDLESMEHHTRSMNDGQIEDIEAVAALVKAVKSELERRQQIKLKRVCIAAAGRALKTLKHSSSFDLSQKQTISPENIHAAELDAVRSAEEAFSEQYPDGSFYCVGHSVISLELDGYIVKKPEGHRGNTLTTTVIAAFLPAYVVESLCAAVDIAGLETAGLTLEPIAAINAVVPPELRLINIVMCDIGAGTSDVAAARDGSVAAYGMATVAGDEITEALMKALLVDFNTAERIKTSTAESTEYTDILLTTHTVTAQEVQSLIKPAAENLADTVCKEILSANGDTPQAVFLVGGGSKLTGLSDMVAERLGLPTQRILTGSREIIRGITAPKSIKLGTEHITPIGIAITSSDEVKYDFTTITVNGKKIRALDTKRLNVLELCNIAGIKPEQLMAHSGQNLSFTADNERITLRGTHGAPAELTLNGKPCSLNSPVRKGDELVLKPAQSGEDAAALLSDYYELSGMSAFSVSLFGNRVTAGCYLKVNGRIVTKDEDIENDSEITLVKLTTLGELMDSEGVSEEVFLNGAAADRNTALSEGDEITKGQSNVLPIILNGSSVEFPAKPGQTTIFLDILAAFSDEPSKLLSGSANITLNGKIPRMDEEIKPGDEIIIE